MKKKPRKVSDRNLGAGLSYVVPQVGGYCPGKPPQANMQVFGGVALGARSVILGAEALGAILGHSLRSWDGFEASKFDQKMARRV